MQHVRTDIFLEIVSQLRWDKKENYVVAVTLVEENYADVKFCPTEINFCSSSYRD